MFLNLNNCEPGLIAGLNVIGSGLATLQLGFLEIVFTLGIGLTLGGNNLDALNLTLLLEEYVLGTAAGGLIDVVGVGGIGIGGRPLSFGGAGWRLGGKGLTCVSPFLFNSGAIGGIIDGDVVGGAEAGGAVVGGAVVGGAVVGGAVVGGAVVGGGVVGVACDSCALSCAVSKTLSTAAFFCASVSLSFFAISFAAALTTGSLITSMLIGFRVFLVVTSLTDFAFLLVSFTASSTAFWTGSLVVSLLLLELLELELLLELALLLEVALLLEAALPDFEPPLLPPLEVLACVFMKPNLW